MAGEAELKIMALSLHTQLLDNSKQALHERLPEQLHGGPGNFDLSTSAPQMDEDRDADTKCGQTSP